MTRVALDLLVGDPRPEVLVEAALLAVAQQPGLEVLLVGPPQDLPAVRAAGRVALVDAPVGLDATADPVHAVRATPDCSVRVGAELVRSGAADALVSAGPGAAAAASFVLGPLPGAGRPALARVLRSPGGPAVLLDTGAAAGGTPLGRFEELAVTGAAWAREVVAAATPRVAALAGPDGRPQPAGAPALHLVPPVDGAALARGGDADVVVTSGDTGALLLGVLRAVVRVDPGALLLGAAGTVLLVDPGSGAEEVAACLRTAARAAGRLADIAAALSALVERRRAAAGLGAAP